MTPDQTIADLKRDADRLAALMATKAEDDPERAILNFARVSMLHAIRALTTASSPPTVPTIHPPKET